MKAASRNSTTQEWSFQCECPFDKKELSSTNGGMVTLAAYAFDRFGHVFKPGLAVIPSVAPLVLTILPFVIAFGAMAAMHRAKCMKTRPRPTFGDNDVVNPMHTTAGVVMQEQHQRRAERLRRQSVSLADANIGFRSIRVIQKNFRVETSNERGGKKDEDGDKRPTGVISRVLLRYSCQRRWWSAMKGSHELLAIFTGHRKPGMGANERLVIFIGCLYSNMLGATLMFHQYVHRKSGTPPTRVRHPVVFVATAGTYTLFSHLRLPPSPPP